MRFLVLLLLSTCLTLGQSTVNFSAGPGQRDVRLATGAPVTLGTVSVGFFEGDVWHLYGVTDVREIFGEPGRFAGNASSTDPVFAGEQIFMQFDAGFTGGLYTSASPDWIFPEPFALPPGNTVSINTSQIDTALAGFFNDNHIILVPEPSPLSFWTIIAVIAVVGYVGSLIGKEKQ